MEVIKVEIEELREKTKSNEEILKEKDQYIERLSKKVGDLEVLEEKLRESWSEKVRIDCELDKHKEE